MSEKEISVLPTKPVRPDAEEVKVQTQKLTETIEKYATRIQEIKELTANRKGSRSHPSEKERTLAKSLQETRNTFQATLRQKQTIRDELNKANQARESLKARVRNMKENVKFSSVEEIDVQIKNLEEKIGKSDLTRKEQEESIAQLKQLVRSRETVLTLRKQLDSLQSDGNLSEDLVERLKDIDAELDKWKAQEKVLVKELDQLKKEREDEEADASVLNAEKQECWQVLCALRAKKKEINDAFSARIKEFRRLDQEYRKQKREFDRKEREANVQSNAEPEEKEIVRPDPVPKEPRKERPRNNRRRVEVVVDEEALKKEKERKQEERRQRQIAYQRNLQREKASNCEFLLKYLSNRLPSTKELPRAETVLTTEEKEPSPPDAGMRPLKKENEERDAWLLGGGKGKKAKSRNKKPAKVERPEDKILLYSKEILESFEAFRIQVPATQADIPKAIQALEDLKMRYENGEVDPILKHVQTETEKPTEPSSTTPDQDYEILTEQKSVESPSEEPKDEIETDVHLEGHEEDKTETTDVHFEEHEENKTETTNLHFEEHKEDKTEKEMTEVLFEAQEEVKEFIEVPSATYHDPPFFENMSEGVDEAQVKVIDTLSFSEQTKSQLPATLEDLDPLESIGENPLGLDDHQEVSKEMSEPSENDSENEENTEKVPYVLCVLTSKDDTESTLRFNLIVTKRAKADLSDLE